MLGLHFVEKKLSDFENLKSLEAQLSPVEGTEQREMKLQTYPTINDKSTSKDQRIYICP